MRNTDLTTDERIRRDYGLLTRALVELPASCATRRQPQATPSTHTLSVLLRHQPAMQQAPARQWMFRDWRITRQHAIVGTSESCIATHPSDMAIAMRALDAVIETVKADGARRSIPIATFTACLAIRLNWIPYLKKASSSRPPSCRRRSAASTSITRSATARPTPLRSFP